MLRAVATLVPSGQCALLLWMADTELATLAEKEWTVH